MRMTFAWIVMAVTAAACKGGDASRDGGLLADAGSDATVGTVSVTVVHGGKPVAGAHVYFQNPDGTRADFVDTDAAGNASAMMLGGGSIWAGYTQPSGVTYYYLYTVLRVSPGDHILVGQTGGPFTQYGVVTFGATDRGAGTTGYYASNGCGTGFLSEPPTSTAISVSSLCADPTGRFDGFARAIDSTSTMVGYSQLLNLAMNADAGMVTANYTFNQGWTTPTTHTTVTTDFPPSGWQQVFRSVIYSRNGRSYYADTHSDFSGQGYTSSLTLPTAPFFDSEIVGVSVRYGTDQNNIDSRSDHRERDGVNDTVEIHYPNFLPKIHDPQITIAGGQLQFAFTADGPLDHAHGGVFQNFWQEYADAGATAPYHYWYCAFDPSVSPVVVGPLPSELAAWANGAQRAAYPGGDWGSPDLSIIRSTAIGSYAAFRADPFTLMSVNPSGAFSLYITSMIQQGT